LLKHGVNFYTEIFLRHFQGMSAGGAVRGGFMRQFSAASVLAAVVSLCFVMLIAGCGSSKVATPVAAAITLSPPSLSLNEGQVAGLTATALDGSGNSIIVDYTYTSSNSGLASVSSAGLVCGGQFDSNSIVCSPHGDGQATITVTSGSVTTTATVYVHKQVDRVVVAPLNDCATMGTVLTPSASAYNTSAPGCSLSAPCDITSTVGPFTYGTGDLTVVASAAGINATYSSSTKSPTYTAGGTITGNKGQTCNLSNFSVGGGTGIDPTFSPSKNSPTYQSGGSISGSAGQTCNLSNFNGIGGATAIVTLTDTNTIASGTRLIVTSSGSGGGSTAPATATFSSGTATCSGTANVTTSLIDIQGVDPVIGATGTVTLTATNAIASGTQLSITNQGYGAIAPPTTAKLSNGTATCSGTASVVTTLNNATGLTAQNPGSTVILASVAGVNSVGAPYTTCPVQSISVHQAGTSVTNISLTGGQTASLVADVLDSKGQSIKPNLTWATSESGAASITSSNNAATITGAGPGTTSVTATCITPSCNVNLNPNYPLGVVTASVSGASPDIVYAASTKSLTMVPIPATTNAVGTAITLPRLPNSIITSPAGNRVYLGADSGGVMYYDTSTSTVSTLGFNGKLLAITSDGIHLVVFDKSSNATYFYNVSTNVFDSIAYGIGTAAVTTPDNQWSLSLIDRQVVRQGVAVGTTPTNLGYQPSGVAVLASGSVMYITNSAGHSVDLRSTCDQSELQTLSATNPTLIHGTPNGTGAVAVDSPKIDVITTGPPSSTCPATVFSTISSYDLQAGNFTPTQLLLSFDSARAWLLTNGTSVLTFDLSGLTPTSIPIANSAQAFTCGLTLDNGNLYLGASDDNVHRIALSSLSDAQQIAPGLKDSNSNLVVPDLVAVLPK
jgi:hypothetical protein